MDFIKSGIESNCRLDGRTLDQQAELKIIPSISASSHGSSQVILSDSNVQAIVNFSIVAPDEQFPDEGVLELSISAPALFNPADLSQRDENIKNIIETLQFQKNCFDKHCLCIVQGHFVWNVKIHIVVLQRGGSLIDAISISIVAALRSCPFPELDIMLKDEMKSTGNAEDIKLLITRYRKCKNISDMMMRLPIITTVVQIGSNYLCDVTKDEENRSEGSVSTAIDQGGRCVGIKLSGNCFKLNLIQTLINKCAQIANQKYINIENALKITK